MKSVLCSLSNLLLLSASFLKLLGSSTCGRQAWASAGTYFRRLIPRIARRRKKRKHLVQSLWCVLYPQWRAKTLAFICLHCQLGNEYTGIFRQKKKKIATGKPIWADTEETTGNLYSVNRDGLPFLKRSLCKLMFVKGRHQILPSPSPADPQTCHFLSFSSH